jgi:hypothetical protein
LIGENIRRARHNEVSSQVAILKRVGDTILPDRDVICSGVLISKQDVLTAEHCIQGEEIHNILITAGSKNILLSSKFYPSWWISYDQWRRQINKRIPKPWNDIAIIRVHYFFNIIKLVYK